MAERRLLMVVNDPAFLVSHRLPIAVAALAHGYDVHVASPPGAAVAHITGCGITHHVVTLHRSSLAPWREFASLFGILSLMRRLRPDVVHLVTPKAVVYGGIAARLLRTRGVVAAISGLGYVFAAEGWRARLLRPVVLALYRFVLARGAVRVVLQNPSDLQVLSGARAIDARKAVLVPGSGVDLDEFQAVPEPEGVGVVLMLARLLVDKGVREFVAAAEILRSRGSSARFLLAGALDPGNPSSISPEEVARLRSEGNVEVLGHRTDVARLMADANLVVLPSYREGMPKVLLEAAACGRAVVTTDVPGCRDAVVANVTGAVVAVRDPVALASAIETLLSEVGARTAMGRAARRVAEQRFGVDSIVSVHLDIYDELTGRATPAPG